MRRIDGTLIGESQQLGVERLVQQTAEIARRPTECHAQIGTTDVTDEKRVASEHGLRIGGAAIEIVDDEGNRLDGVSWRLEYLQPDSTEVDDITVVERSEFVLGSRGGAEIDRRPGAIAQLEVTGDEVRVEVREEDVPDPQIVLGGERKIVIDVALWIDDSRRARLLVPDEVRRVRQTIQVKLLEDHVTSAYRPIVIAYIIGAQDIWSLG